MPGDLHAERPGNGCSVTCQGHAWTIVASGADRCGSPLDSGWGSWDLLDWAGPTIDSGCRLRGHQERVMSVAHVNGTNIFYELHGTGEPLVLVHGSWADTTQWELERPRLAGSFQVLVYDRRGHSRSERPKTRQRCVIGRTRGQRPARASSQHRGRVAACRIPTPHLRPTSALLCHARRGFVVDLRDQARDFIATAW
jgi:hypothetical protein